MNTAHIHRSRSNHISISHIFPNSRQYILLVLLHGVSFIFGLLLEQQWRLIVTMAGIIIWVFLFLHFGDDYWDDWFGDWFRFLNDNRGWRRLLGFVLPDLLLLLLNFPFLGQLLLEFLFLDFGFHELLLHELLITLLLFDHFFLNSRKVGTFLASLVLRASISFSTVSVCTRI